MKLRGDFISVTTPVLYLFVAAFCCYGCAGPAPRPFNLTATGRYGHQLHDVFYEAWEQPRAVALPRGKIAVPVKVAIDQSGRVVNFRILKASGNAKIDNSIAAVGGKIRQVQPPPFIGRGKVFKVKILFELDVTPTSKLRKSTTALHKTA